MEPSASILVGERRQIAYASDRGGTTQVYVAML
jgi:hypothetical protein